KAIVDDFSGVTRDRQYGMTDWNGKTFHLVDTGGFVSQSEDIFEREIRKQVQIAMEEAHLILFMVDGTTGITDQDEDMARILRKSEKPVFLVINKIDNPQRAWSASEFYGLGFEQTYMLSSISGSGTGELLDDLVARIPEDRQADQGDDIPRFIIIGQPNAGKSTLLNALIGQERSIVSPIAGTTRDTINTRYNLFGKDFLLMDTAGLRKKKSVKDNLEFYSVIRAVRAMDDADVCLLMIGAQEGISAQDVNIFALAARQGKGILILVRKWDLVEKDTHTAKNMEKLIREKIAPFRDVPILFVSATEKLRIFQAVEKALEVYENRRRRIPTSQLNDVLLPEIEKYPPPIVRGHSVKIKFITQIPTVVPSFSFFTNFPDAIKLPYKNFLENKIRAHFS